MLPRRVPPITSHTTQVLCTSLLVNGQSHRALLLHLDLLPWKQAVVCANASMTLKLDLERYRALSDFHLLIPPLSCQELTGPSVFSG